MIKSIITKYVLTRSDVELAMRDHLKDQTGNMISPAAKMMIQGYNGNFHVSFVESTEEK